MPLVVVGGDMSGLVTSYLLRDYRPILLEQAQRLGGNSQGQSWRGIDYAIGAATSPSRHGVATREAGYRAGPAGALDHGAGRRSRGAVGKDIQPRFWDGRTSAEETSQFDKLARYFISLHKGEDGMVYPDIRSPIRHKQPISKRSIGCRFKPMWSRSPVRRCIRTLPRRLSITVGRLSGRRPRKSARWRGSTFMSRSLATWRCCQVETPLSSSAC